MRTTIVMVRHGETDWNRENRFQGQANPRLNELGRVQAQELAAELAGETFDVAYASPLERAHETACILAAPLGLEVQISDALREVDVGSWEGLTVSEVEARFPDAYRRWVERGAGWEDGESYEELGERVVATLFEFAGRHRGGTVLAVTHGGPIRSALAAAMGRPFEEVRPLLGSLANCAVVRFAVREGMLERVD